MIIHTDNKETLQNALKRIDELEAQISVLEKENTKAKKACSKWFKRWREAKKLELEQIAQIEKMKSDVVRCFGDEYNVLVAKLLEEWKLKE